MILAPPLAHSSIRVISKPLSVSETGALMTVDTECSVAISSLSEGQCSATTESTMTTNDNTVSLRWLVISHSTYTESPSLPVTVRVWLYRAVTRSSNTVPVLSMTVSGSLIQVIVVAGPPVVQWRYR